MFQKNAFKKFPVIFLIFANAIVLGLNWFIAAWRFGVSEEFIPLHYTIYFGVDRFGPRFDIFLFPTLGLTLFAVNILIYKILFNKNALWQGVFMGLTFLFELILLSALILSVLKSVS